MTRSEFAAGVEQLRLAFDLAEVRKQVLATWYSHGIDQIPAADWQRIVRQVILSEDRFPPNFIRTVLGYRGPVSKQVVIERPSDLTDAEVAENVRAVNRLIHSMGQETDDAF